ncbi:MAG TPA: helicase C-terminal domain-containing protein [Ktedonobacteraceae bacterium]|nr:helicase C-terminal domain-containing protein [Ktedonobacteraceae bacterium]
MEAIPQWKIQDDDSNNKTQVTFEDGTLLTWVTSSGRVTLEVKGEGRIYQEVLTFTEGYDRQLYGSFADFSKALSEAFPPRPLPQPVSGYDFLSEWSEGDRTDYYFTQVVIISYWEEKRQIIFQSEDKGDNALRSAFEMAFPRGYSLLSREELRGVLAGLCAPLPTANKRPRRSERGYTKPLERSVAYKSWYPYESVRIAAQEGEKCQQEVMDAWWDTLTRGALGGSLSHHLFVHAPTGLGKTAATLAPALAWQQQQPGRRQIYYVVATVNQHDNPVAELQRLYRTRAEQGQKTPLRIVDLAGQSQHFGPRDQKFCLHPHAHSADPVCTASRHSAAWDIFAGRPVSWRESADILAAQGYCPYHFLQGLMATADVVVCDYWWVFNPEAARVWSRTSHFGSKEVALIVDEAHNLIPRLRESYDVSISREQLHSLLAHTTNHAAKRALAPLANIVFEKGDLADKARSRGLTPAVLLPLLDTDALQEAQVFWEQQSPSERGDKQMSDEECIIHNLLAPVEDAVIIYVRSEKNGENGGDSSDPLLVMRRIDATRDLARGYGIVKASVTISGTLVAPNDPERELERLVPQFGLPRERTDVLKASTPFSLSNQLWVYDSQPLGTYYHRKASIPYYCNAIAEIGKATQGGVTAVFFSSYEFMRSVYNRMPQGEKNLVVYEREGNGKEGESEDLHSLEEYERELRRKMEAFAQEHRAYLFALYAGKIAQGANFRNNLLKTIICVSIPMEMVELFHLHLCYHLWPILYPDQARPQVPLTGPSRVAAWADAWQYAYERPSMYQVLQATGRGIRTPEDRCAFVLLDRRYDELRWHEFLVPTPFHTSTPHMDVEIFHEGAPRRFLDVSDRWEPKLFSLKPL